ncbi:hypothetical protein, partial [uncultured Intestinimonas sp.]|uniref:hypothetical protein n=1 Tax=uncultured Intestinimonas sp. TaxID=1689265 RepID=UPI0029423A05
MSTNLRPGKRRILRRAARPFQIEPASLGFDLIYLPYGGFIYDRPRPRGLRTLRPAPKGQGSLTPPLVLSK